MIGKFLTHHKRGCPANRDGNCECGLFEARADLRRFLDALVQAGTLADWINEIREACPDIIVWQAERFKKTLANGG